MCAISPSSFISGSANAMRWQCISRRVACSHIIFLKAADDDYECREVLEQIFHQPPRRTMCVCVSDFFVQGHSLFLGSSTSSMIFRRPVAVPLCKLFTHRICHFCHFCLLLLHCWIIFSNSIGQKSGL